MEENVNQHKHTNHRYPEHFFDHGYPEHFIIGGLIAGLIFWIVFKKTGSNMKSWILAVTILSAIGLVKELIDPCFGRTRDLGDLIATVIGGIIGAGIIIPIMRLKQKK